MNAGNKTLIECLIVCMRKGINMVNETISTILVNGMNNPDCSFFVGATFGQWLAIKYIMILVLLYFILKIIDKLALEPLIKWIKDEIRR